MNGNAYPSTTLRRIARRLQSHAITTVPQRIAVGKLLTEAKATLPRGRFVSWVSDNFPHSYTLAKECIRLFRHREIDALRLFRVSAVRCLTKKRLRKMRSRLTLEQLPKKKGISAQDIFAVMPDKDMPVPRAGKDTEERVFPEQETESMGRMIAQLVEKSEAVYIATHEDDEDDAAKTLQITVYPITAEPPTAHFRGSLLEVLAVANGEEIMSLCPRCKRDLPPTAFSRSTKYCRQCERTRVKVYFRRKRAENRASKKRVLGEFRQPDQIIQRRVKRESPANG